jgi:predicted permease
MRYIYRRWRHAPLFTALALVTLAIGIGANAAIFSVVHGVLIKPLNYPDSDRLVSAPLTAPGLNFPQLFHSPATYFTVREEARAFEEFGVWGTGAASITGVAEPERVDAVVVTDGVLKALGVRPQLGRVFSREDDTPGAPETVVLSWGYWQRRFAADGSVIGRRVLVDSKAREVIGVMPRSFRFPNAEPAVFMPLRFDRATTVIGNFSWQSVARLKPGVTIAAANADIGRVLPMMIRKFPPAPGMSAKMVEEARLTPAAVPLKNDVVGDTGKVLWVLMATVGIVLFIASANVANLLLVRAEGRQHELAIRAALGAGWKRLAGDLLLESVALAVAGGLLGILLAYAGLEALVAAGPASLPRLAELSIDLPVLAFAFAVSLICGLLFGLVPVVKYAGPRIAQTIRDGGRAASDGRERHRARGMLVVAQVALALVLLIGSGLMIRTFQALRRVEPGFVRPEEVLTLRVAIPQAQVPKVLDAVRMQAEMKRRIEALPQVSAVALTNSVTMDGNYDNDPLFIEGRAYSEGQIPPLRRYKFISPDYFKMMGSPILAGRDFTWPDIYEGRQVVMASENFARENFGSPGAAIGKRVRENPKGPWREIVGVTRNERDDGVDKPAPALIYWPIYRHDFWGDSEAGQRSLVFAIRSPRTGTAAFLKDVSQAIWSVNPNLPLANPRTLFTVYNRSMARTSFTLVMLGIAAAMALVLGLVGIYGVLSYSVAQRTREIGIRIALGAPETRVRRMFLGHGLRLAGVGITAGLAAAAALTRLMSALLFEVSPLDPVTYCAVPAVLLAAALLAAYVPARRATTIAPIEALRTD